MWYKFAKTGISEEDLNRELKDRIRKDMFFHRLFDDYGVSLDTIDNHLQFHIAELKDRHAHSKGEDIYLSNNLFSDGKFFDESLHFVVHELTHWLTRMREKISYFTDPEEIEAFTLGMTFEMLRGKSEQDIMSIFFPIIQGETNDPENAKKLFKSLLAKAKLRLKRFSN